MLITTFACPPPPTTTIPSPLCPVCRRTSPDSGWLANHVLFQKGWQLRCLIGTKFSHLPNLCSQSFSLIKVVPRCRHNFCNVGIVRKSVEFPVDIIFQHSGQ